MSVIAPRWFWPLFLAAIAAAAIWASPFRYDYGNSGRYLLVVAKKMDPALFPNDPAVAIMERFDSLFYRALPRVLNGPEQLEGGLFKIYVGMKIALVLSLFWLIRSLAREPLAAVLLLAWCSQNCASLLGGIPLFTNTATHSEVVQVLGILAILCAVRRLYWAFWLTLCAALFIHSLMTVHLLACVFPVILVCEREKRLKFLLGAAAFGACFLAYLHWMTPPPMSREEAAIFIGAKGNMLHISPMAQSKINCVQFCLMFVLAMVGQRRWLSAEPAAKKIISFAIAGTIVALLLGFAAIFGRSLSIMQVQPMRIFFWVTLLLMVVIAWSASAALSERHPIAWALVGVVLFGMVDSVWALGLALLAIVGCVLPKAKWPGWLPWMFVAAVGACAILGHRVPLQSVRDPWLLVPAVGLLLLAKISEWNKTGTLWLASCLCLCVAAVRMEQGWAGVGGHNHKSSRQNWLAVCQWCEKNSAKNDLFLTPPTEDNFRLHALRSSIGEEMSALAWVAPCAYKTNMELAAAIQKDFKNGSWDLNSLRAAARANGARFVLIDGPFDPPHQAAFAAGTFSLHRVDD